MKTINSDLFPITRKAIALFVLLSLSSLIPLFAQTSVSGVVKDSKTGETLPFVSIYFKGTTTGTQSDIPGKYFLSINKGVDSVVFSSMGYATLTLPVKSNQSNLLNVVMDEGGIEIEEVTVKETRKRIKDTTAIKVYREVVKHKQDNRMSSYAFYSYKDHVKMEFDLFNVSEGITEKKFFKPFGFIFENLDTTEKGEVYLPFLIKEQIYDQYYRSDPEASKRIVLADQFSGVNNSSVGALLDARFDQIDVYDNVIILNDKSFIGPFASGALINYNYYLYDSFYVDSMFIYELIFTPKSPQNLAFYGYAHIDKETWGIKEIEMRIAEKANINFVNDFYLKQAYELTDSAGWFLQGEEMHKAVNIGKNENSTSWLIKKNITRDSISVNVPIDPKIFKGDAIQFQPLARERDAEYWSEARIDSLSESEAGIYYMVDTVQSTKAYNKYYWWFYLATSAYFKAGPVEFGRFYKFVSWNDIEGVRLRFGGRTTTDFSKKVMLDGYVAYGTKDESQKWKYNFGLQTHLKRVNDRWHMFEIRYLDDYTRLGVQDPLLTYDNIMNSILRTSALDDLLRQQQFSFNYQREWLKGLMTTAHFSHTKWKSVPGRFEYSTTDEEGNIVPVPSFNAVEMGLETRIAFKEMYYENTFFRYSLGSYVPIVTVNYNIGIKDFLGGDYTYHKLSANFSHRWNNPIGYTKYQIFGGAVLNQVPYSLLEFPSGNETFIYDKYRYNMMNEFEFVVDRWAGIWIDHHFDGFFFNRIPGWKKLKLRELITFKGLWGTVSDKNAPGNGPLNYPTDEDGNVTLSTLDGFYFELGFGIENILKILRVDFVWRLSQQGQPEVKKWWFKIGIQPKF